ncbi:MAG: NAD(P)H-hydrate epimerase [Ruminococcus sp.]|nr:NAD(P)H-hydrate epimerase [Ruminococcus sp.]
MQKILTTQTMRHSDAGEIARGTSGRELMYRAGVGIFQSCDWNGRIAILAGSGNNAGDGYVLAKLLADVGKQCYIIRCANRCSADGAYYLEMAKSAGVEITEELQFSHVDIVVDCLLGTGFHGELRSDLKKVVAAVNAFRGFVLSVDINSGLHGDTGAGNCICSNRTVSIGFMQPGHLVGLHKSVMQEVYNYDIGIPCEGKYIPFYEAEETPVFLPEVHEFPMELANQMESAGITFGSIAERLQQYQAPIRNRIHFFKV